MESPSEGAWIGAAAVENPANPGEYWVIFVGAALFVCRRGLRIDIEAARQFTLALADDKPDP
jgi:hypothetical protein